MGIGSIKDFVIADCMGEIPEEYCGWCPTELVDGYCPNCLAFLEQAKSPEEMSSEEVRREMVGQLRAGTIPQRERRRRTDALVGRHVGREEYSSNRYHRVVQEAVERAEERTQQNSGRT